MYARTASSPAPGYAFLDDDDAALCAALESEIGSRPATLYTTSRGPLSESQGRAKRLYRVPVDAALRDGYSGGDIIDHFHRFAFIGPTRNAKTHEPEQWYLPDGTPLPGVPTADDIVQHVAQLPAAWLDHLTRDRPYADAPSYSGSLDFDGGDVAPWLSDIAGTWGDWSEYPQAQRALWNLAGVAVMLPNTPGIDTLRLAITSEYVNRANASSSPADSESALDRAWTNGLAKQAAERDVLEAEVGAASLAWAASRAPVPPHRTELERLEALTVEQAEAEFGWNWENALPQAQMRAEALEARATQSASASSSSWAPRDLSDVMAGDYVAPKPTVFRRTDGMGMFYPGVVNEFHAVGGTGKTLAALAVCDEALRDGQTVLYVDYEEHPSRIVQRLRGYGISDEAIQSRFMYVKPTEKPTQAALDALVDLSPSVVIIDTFAESFNNLTGGDSHRTDDVTAWFSLPRLFADAGACVIVTDHIPKDAQNKLMPIGSQAKHSGYKGAIYFLEAPTGAGLLKGEHGRLRFILGKDNGGEMGVRTGECAATFYLDATGEVSMWELQAPDTGAMLAEAAATLSADRERIADALPVPSRAQLWEALGVNKNSTDALRAALTGMIEDGSVIEEKVGNALTLRLASNKAPTPEADAEAAVWGGFVPRPDHVPMSPAPVPEDKEDIGSGIHRIQLDVQLDDFPAPRSPFEGISDAELDDLLGGTSPN